MSISVKGGHNTQDLKLGATDPRGLSPVALAFIGDSVFELLVRERLLENGGMPAHKLHRLAVQKVRASSQARAFSAIEAVLDNEELGILKRGRNANTSRVPKSCTPEEYRKATALESLFGYLYLKGDMSRIAELYSVIDRQLTEDSRQ